MNQAISEYIRIYGEALHLPENIIEDAKNIITQYDGENNKLRGNTLEVVACAGILLSCKLWNNPINAKIISARIPVPTLRKDQKQYLSITKIARKIARKIDFRPQQISIHKYIDVVINELGLDDNVRTLSYWINSLVNETNSSTQALASTIVYLSAKILHNTITEKGCVSVLHITEPALRKCKRQLIMQGVVIKKRSRYYLGGKDGKEK